MHTTMKESSLKLWIVCSTIFQFSFGIIVAISIYTFSQHMVSLQHEVDLLRRGLRLSDGNPIDLLSQVTYTSDYIKGDKLTIT